jgi:hypothetical protein
MLAPTVSDAAAPHIVSNEAVRDITINNYRIVGRMSSLIVHLIPEYLLLIHTASDSQTANGKIYLLSLFCLFHCPSHSRLDQLRTCLVSANAMSQRAIYGT